MKWELVALNSIALLATAAGASLLAWFLAADGTDAVLVVGMFGILAAAVLSGIMLGRSLEHS